MFNAETAYSIALQIACESVEEQIRVAVSQGKFLVYANELHTEVAKYLRDLGYDVRWGTSKAAFIYWYSK